MRAKDIRITSQSGKIALDDVDVSNGCLRYIDGSHRGPILPHEAVPGEPHNLTPADRIDRARQSLAPVGKGGVVFHHVQTLHGSARNESDRWRRAHATHWITAEVEDMDGPEGRLKDAYCRRPELAEVFVAGS